jgi:type IV pilus assembly protein PilV
MITIPLPPFRTPGAGRQRGTTMIEVLVTMVILAFGLLGIAAFQSKAQMGNIESYQRAQAMVLLEDMSARMTTNSANAAAYASADTDPAVANTLPSTAPVAYGTGDAQPTDCSTKTVLAARDLCEWSNALKGQNETAGTAKIGAMSGGRGCIVVKQAADSTSGTCKPGIYQISVSWQGLHKTKEPSLACGLNSYGDEQYHRVVAMRLTIGLPNCT